MFNERFSFPPFKLTLYLSLKNGKWLNDTDRKDIFFDKECTKMQPTWKPDNKELFGAGGTPERCWVCPCISLIWCRARSCVLLLLLDWYARPVAMSQLDDFRYLSTSATAQRVG
ncbi:hypothetical protein P3T76_002265 [Phytophthora citrophthora]|uniref:Uncharacterized protein n=1 Tax=Phytophthora citrophthora TaxID=4793 RepID=A0AAD9GZ31_9STRA|nr:hypothetical protein P3T76_002265 [Phytophthora citrophthora]